MIDFIRALSALQFILLAIACFSGIFTLLHVVVLRAYYGWLVLIGFGATVGFLVTLR